MQIVEIKEQGWDSFSGDLGGIEFLNGVSTRPLTDREVIRIGAGMRIESVETGKQLGVSAQLVELTDKPMLSEEREQGYIDDPVIIDTNTSQVNVEYSREDLESIADREGIVAIRKIADKYDIKAKSMAQLIDGILNVNVG